MKIVVLMGGNSAEREVSLTSGRAVATALESRGHQVALIDTALSQLPEGEKELPKDHVPQPHPVQQSTPQSIGSEPPRPAELPEDSDKLAVRTVAQASIFAETDVVFLAFHGGAGENGCIQGVLDMLGVPYTGSGVLASAMAMDKDIAKCIFQQVGVRTAPWITLRKYETNRIPDIVSRINDSFGFPCVVKPVDQGSTVGLTIVENPDWLEEAISLAKEYSREVLIEKYIPGRELTVAILGDKALPVVEIRPKHGIYDYECKYTKGMSEYLVPAPIPPEVESEIQSQALKAFRALKCSGYARVDFRMSPQNELFCLEVNTLPGMTATSLVPKAAKAIGIEFPELTERIVKLAIDKKRAI